ncbi:hypothetical protein [Actinomadura formosensis]|uniref:hypothetical protein n=1 Tax=Actinomadura formosensis TaxID=60706 RepID=UPI00082E0A5D|nr:hypothetical protein [Actinomadura formosensis]
MHNTAGPRDADGRAADGPLYLPRRFNGPRDSAQGGYACGRIAAATGLDQRAGVAVTLLRPLPLDAGLAVRRAGRRWHVWHGADLVASAEAAPSDGPPVPALGGHDTVEGPAPGGGSPIFATCFVCGTERTGDDGLRLSARAVRGRPDTVAVTWTPAAEHCDGEGFARSEFLWAALDCPGGWAIPAEHRKPLVLNRFRTAVYVRPPAGTRIQIVGRLDGRAERTVTVSTAAYADGVLCARARAQWVIVDAAQFGPG